MPITVEKKSSTSIPWIILFLAATGAAGYFYWSGTEAIKDRANLTRQVSLLENEKTTESMRAQDEVGTLKTKLQEIDKALVEAEQAKRQLELELKSKTDEMAGMQNRYESRIGELERDVKRYADFSAILATEMKPIKEALLGAGAGGAGSSAAASDTENSSSDTSTTTPLALNAQSADLVSGQVVSVDQKFGFVVTNVGADQGMAPGRIIQIYQRGEPLGLGRIEKSQKTVSAASVVSEDVLSRVKEGDRVVLL